MPHSINLIVNAPELNEDCPAPIQGFDVALEIDGKPFAATKFTLIAEGGKAPVKAIVEFAVNTIDIKNPSNLKVDTEFVLKEEGASRTVSIFECSKAHATLLGQRIPMVDLNYLDQTLVEDPQDLEDLEE
jgi:hypothetical protein